MSEIMENNHNGECERSSSILSSPFLPLGITLMIGSIASGFIFYQTKNTNNAIQKLEEVISEKEDRIKILEEQLKYIDSALANVIPVVNELVDKNKNVVKDNYHAPPKSDSHTHIPTPPKSHTHIPTPPKSHTHIPTPPKSDSHTHTHLSTPRIVEHTKASVTIFTNAPPLHKRNLPVDNKIEEIEDDEDEDDDTNDNTLDKELQSELEKLKINEDGSSKSQQE